MATRQDASTGELVEDGDKKAFVPKDDPTLMQIKVYSPYQTYYNELATSISAVNATGPFDILKGHDRFLTLLDPCELVIHGKSGIEKIKISHGIMYVKEDKVTVFLDV